MSHSSYIEVLAQFNRLVKAFLSFVRMNSEASIIVNVIGGAAPEPDDKSPFRFMVDNRDLLCQADGVMQRHLGDSQSDLDLCGGDRKRQPLWSATRKPGLGIVLW